MSEPPSNSSGHLLTAENVCKRFGTSAVLRGIDLRVDHDETCVILGDSGCGKTTLLKILSGSVPSDSGLVTIEGKNVLEMPPQERGIVYLDQEPLLFDHLNVFENIAFALRLRRCKNLVIQTRVSRMLEAIDLAEHRNKRSWQLSGGQRQRIAFARAILAQPKVLLLDEPFCSLDDRTRQTMHDLYQQLKVEFRFSALFVTHDIKEALIVGDRFGFMSAGQIDLFQDREIFIKDARTGISQEIKFWERVSSQSAD